jgi:carnosine N-methyltransferase
MLTLLSTHCSLNFPPPSTTNGWSHAKNAIDKAILVNASFLAQIVADPETFGHDIDGNEEVIPAESDPALQIVTLQVGTGLLIPKSKKNSVSERIEGTSQQSHSHSHSHSHSQSHSTGHTHSHGELSTKSDQTKTFKPSEFDMDKLRSTLKQFVRDWSEEVLILFSNVGFY